MWGMNECRRFISPKTILKGKQLDENSIWQLDDSEDTVFHQLLSLPTEEEIVDFVMQYASKRPKFRSDLMDWIKQHYLAPGEDCQSLTYLSNGKPWRECLESGVRSGWYATQQSHPTATVQSTR